MDVRPVNLGGISVVPMGNRLIRDRFQKRISDIRIIDDGDAGCHLIGKIVELAADCILRTPQPGM